MSNEKIELRYWFKGEEFTLVKELGNVNIFMNEGADQLYICNNAGTILTKVDADCSQNQGFMCVK